MTNGAKIVTCIIIAVILFGAGLFSGIGIRKAIDNKRFAEYTSTIKSLGSQIDELQGTNSQLTESNQLLENTAAELRNELADALIRIGKAEGLISEIESGLSSSTDDIQRLISAIGRVIDKIIKFGKEE